MWSLAVNHVAYTLQVGLYHVEANTAIEKQFSLAVVRQCGTSKRFSLEKKEESGADSASETQF